MQSCAHDNKRGATCFSGMGLTVKPLIWMVEIVLQVLIGPQRNLAAMNTEIIKAMNPQTITFV